MNYIGSKPMNYIGSNGTAAYGGCYDASRQVWKLIGLKLGSMRLE